MQNIETLKNTIETSTDPKEILAAETALAKLRAEEKAAANRARIDAAERAKAEAEEQARRRAAKGAELQAARAELDAANGAIADAVVALAEVVLAGDKQRRRVLAIHNELANMSPGMSSSPVLEVLDASRVSRALGVALRAEPGEAREKTRAHVLQGLRAEPKYMLNAGLVHESPRPATMSQREAFAALGLEYDDRVDQRLADRVETALRRAGGLGGSMADAEQKVASKVAELRSYASVRGCVIAEVE